MHSTRFLCGLDPDPVGGSGGRPVFVEIRRARVSGLELSRKHRRVRPVPRPPPWAPDRHSSVVRPSSYDARPLTPAVPPTGVFVLTI